jgi:hypothetical protein
MVGPLGCYRQVQQRPPSELATSMAGPLGVLPAGPAVATTRVGDVDGGAPRGAAGRSDSDHHRSWRRRWRAPGGPLLLAAMSSFQRLAGSPARLLSYRCSPSAVTTGLL